MFERLFRMFRAENDNSQLVIIIIIGICVQLIFASFGQAILNSILQFVISWVGATVFSKYVNKNSDTTMMQWWKRIYIIMIVISLIRFIL
jgi:positive regulator of sigma E activity